VRMKGLEPRCELLHFAELSHNLQFLCFNTYDEVMSLSLESNFHGWYKYGRSSFIENI